MRRKMIHNINKLFFSRILVFFAILTLLCGGVQLAGCSSSKYWEKADNSWTKTKRKLFRTGSTGGWKRKVGVALFENKTFYEPQKFEKILEERIRQKLENTCSNILILSREANEYQAFLNQLPRHSSGRLDSLQIVETGRQLGLNAIVTGGLMDIRNKKEDRGFWWFKETLYSIEILMTVEVIDTGTGAKLLDESAIREIEIGEADFDLIKTQQETYFDEISNVIADAASDLAEEVCYAINSEPWKAYILNVEQDGVVVSAGKKSGLKSGKILDVYDFTRIARFLNRNANG